ncbi:unnamed protein product, partial [Rotaria sordida]
MNPVTTAYHFFKKVRQHYNLKEENLLTDAENEKVSQLINFFEEIISSCNLIIEIEHTLDLSEDENTSEDDDENTSESEDGLEDFRRSNKCKYSLEQMQKIVDKSKKKMSFNSLKHHYTKLKNPTEVSRIRRYIAKGATDFEKYELIKDFVWKKFQLGTSKYLPIKDEDLKRWSLQKSKEIKLENFTAVHEWIRQFKISKNISSHKITQVVSSKYETDNNKIKEEGRDFVKYASKKLMNFDR